MSGIVERLREPFSHKPEFGFKTESLESHEETCLEAADTIEKLLEALDFIIDDLPEKPNRVGMYGLPAVSAHVVNEARAAIAKATQP